MTGRTVGIVGAGTMGAGIAQVALEAGDLVRLHDPAPGATAAALERVEAGLTRRATRRHGDAAAARAWVADRLGRLVAVDALPEVASQSETDLVIEAVIEDLETKQAVIRTLDAVASPEVILATNTSALSVASIAAAAARPGRVLGLHFFQPAPVMALVEVVTPPGVDEAVVGRAVERMTRWGKTPIRSADRPGFIVNRVNRPFTIEALRLLEAGDAGVAAIDGAMRAAGYAMGPFELMDLSGLDVNLAAARGIWEGLGRPDHLRPSVIQERLVAADRLGRKRGCGFYRYVDGTPPAPEPDVAGPHVARLPSAAIVDRLELAIGAEARRAAADGVATPADIARALRLGAAHPRDPRA